MGRGYSLPDGSEQIGSPYPLGIDPERNERNSLFMIKFIQYKGNIGPLLRLKG